MVRPDSGAVSFAGADVWGLSDRDRAHLLSQDIGFIAAIPAELDTPVLANIALPLMRVHGQREAYARARDALARVGAAECAGQYWEELADWERALVAVAQGIAREPRLLLVDDLTVSLGIQEADEVGRMLHILASERGFGVLMCVSDADATGWSARIGTLGGGELLLASPSVSEGSVIDLPLNAALGRRAKRI
jgi:putative ABC transport system ATP-binding protein